MSNIRNFDFGSFYIRTTVSSQEHLLVRPGITLTFFLDEPLVASCNAVADLIELFFSVIPRATFRSYLAKNGYYKSLTDRQISKDLKALRNLPDGYEGFTLDYSEAEFGQVGTHAVFFMATELTSSSPDSSNIVRLEFPENIVDDLGEARFLQLVTDAAESLPFFSGYAGLAFKRSMAMESASLKAIAPLLPRYLGFDPSDYWITTSMRGCTLTSHWINLLGSQLTKTLDGQGEIEAIVGQAEIKSLRNGTLIRGSRLPPVGDVNRGANDIGQLPNVARLLRPVRCQNPVTGHANLDAMAWLARFDGLPPKDWDNS